MTTNCYEAEVNSKGDDKNDSWPYSSFKTIATRIVFGEGSRYLPSADCEESRSGRGDDGSVPFDREE